MTRLLAILVALTLAACSPATTRRLCDVSEVALDVARPETPNGKTAASIGRLLRAILCPRASGATDRLPDTPAASL